MSEIYDSDKRVLMQTFRTELGIARSVSQAWRIGRAIALCRKRNDMEGIPSAILELQNGACLFVGKIVDVRRVWYLVCRLCSILVTDGCDTFWI